jgi:hypothetical protein
VIRRRIILQDLASDLPELLLGSDKHVFLHCCWCCYSCCWCYSLHRSRSTSRLCYVDALVETQPEEPGMVQTSRFACHIPCPDPYHGHRSSIHNSLAVQEYRLRTLTLHCSFQQRVSNLPNPSQHPSKAHAGDSTLEPRSHSPPHDADPLPAAGG